MKRTGFECLKYDLSSQYYKLVIKINNLPLCALFRKLNSVYALNYNKIHHREGHLFHGRFKSAPIDNECKSDIITHVSSTDSAKADSSIDQNNQNDNQTSNTLDLKDHPSTLSNSVTREDLDNIHRETQHKYNPRCWNIGRKSFIAMTMSDLQKEHNLVANYTLTDWDLPQLRDFVLSKIPVTINDFEIRGRSNKQSSARKLFAYLATKILNFRIVEVARYLKVSSTAISKLAKMGFLVAKEYCIELPKNPECIAEPVH
ncbi:MAG: hypothetical protein GX640_12985 [Fibrobacter sp.]|nr:hypothetical protein [Fibrobacter sp.]